MVFTNNITMKPLKDIDSVHRSLVLKVFCTLFPLLGLVGWIFIGIIGLLIAAILSLIVALFSVSTAGRFGVMASKLYGGRKPIWNTQEKFSADLSRARVQKMSKHHTEALMIVDNILTEQSDFNEALLLKAQILIEGFDDTIEAKKCLIRIFQTEPKHTQLFQWSETLYKGLVSQAE